VLLKKASKKECQKKAKDATIKGKQGKKPSSACLRKRYKKASKEKSTDLQTNRHL
jgi:hypothetical protein